MVLQCLPQPQYLPGTQPETPEETRIRYSTIATAVALSARGATCEGQAPDCVRIWPGPTWQMAALLVTEAWFESRLMWRVHAGKCGPGECDPLRRGSEIVHRSRSLWQIQHSELVSRSEWKTLSGTDLISTMRASWAAARILAAARRLCSPYGGFSPESTMAAYATGSKCTFSQSKIRAHWYMKVAAQLRSPTTPPQCSAARRPSAP